MYIDYKCTIWKRIQYPDDLTKDNIKDILNNLLVDKNKDDITTDDLITDDTEEDFLYDTMTELTLIDNDNNSTIEIYDENGKEIWNNCNGFSDDEI